MLGQNIVRRTDTGYVYDFILIRVGKIKFGEGKYDMLNLRRYIVGDVVVLEAGELPFLALNTQGLYTYK